MESLLLILIPAFIAVLGLAFVGLIFARLYQRSTKEISFVRTGFGGEKVVMNGGTLILPVLHDKIFVNMKTLKLSVLRQGKDSLITNDRMRVDIISEFYVRVKPDQESISKAAQTLGSKTLDSGELKTLIEGKFVDGLRSVAASMKMEDLHEKRGEFVQQVQQNVAEDLLKNGLELESVSLTSLDQTSSDFFDPNNAFDAEGLTVLTKKTEEKRKERNDVQQNTNLAIQQKNLETKKQSLALSQQEALAQAEQEKKIAESLAEQQSLTKITQSQKEQESESARINAAALIQKAKIENDKQIRIAEQNTKIEIAKKSEEELAAQAKANDAKALEITSQEAIITAKETEIAEREKGLAIIQANKEAQQKSIGLIVAAKAMKDAASDEAEAAKLKATGIAESIKIEAEAKEKMYKVDAEGRQALNEAENTLSESIIALRFKEALLAALPGIVAAVVKPMENIDSIKIVEMGGVQGAYNGVSSGGTSNVSLSDSIVNSAMKYKTHMPVLDSLMKDVGLDLNSVQGLTAPLQEIMVNPVVEVKEDTPII